MSDHSTNLLKPPSWLFLGLIFPLIVLNLWVFIFVFKTFQDVFSTFIVAGFLALLLDHPVSFLKQRLNLSRGNAILIVFLSFVLIFLFIGIILVPVIAIRFSEFINVLPTWIQTATTKVDNLADWANTYSVVVDRNQIINDLAKNFQGQLQTFIQTIPGFLFGTLGNILNIFFILVLTIFFLIYENLLLKTLLNYWFSPEKEEMIQKTLYRNFNSYILNQLVLATTLTVTMIPSLFILKAPFPLLFGLTIGILGFIPFGAVIGILGISFILFLGNFWIGLRVLVVLLLIDQIIENTLPPHLLGKLTGLNPILILLSVMVGATLGDFVGLITAVPIAATIKSLIATFRPAKSSEFNKLVLK